MAGLTLIILFSEMLRIFKIYVFSKNKSLKENKNLLEYLKIYHFSKIKFSKLINYLTNMRWSDQCTMVTILKRINKG
jgi:hypothetical protein